MEPVLLLSGIREMISAQVRVMTTTDPEEKRIAGEIYTVNEEAVLDQLERIDAHFHPERYAR
jgi:hypothetical protein